MKEQELLGHLLDLARRLDFEVRTDQGHFRDGSCFLLEMSSRIQDSGSNMETLNPESCIPNPERFRRVIILNRNSPASRRIAALGRALSQCSLDGIFLLPAVREAIENAGDRRDVSE